MLNDFSGSKVYLACGYTDLRRGIDGLATIVEQQFKLDPCSDALFLFCGRRTDRIKALYWEGDGFLLLYKRLEKRLVSVAAQRERNARYYCSTIPLADGRIEYPTAESSSKNGENKVRIIAHKPA